MSKVENIKKKIEKEHSAFQDCVIGLSVKELKDNILLYTKYMQETMHAIATNPDVKEAEQKLALAKKPYSDKIKESKDKIKQLKSFIDKSICVSDLENQIIIYAMEQEEQKLKMDNCPEVAAAKDELDQVKGPLTDAKKVLQLKISYLNILIDEKEGFEPGYRSSEE